MIARDPFEVIENTCLIVLAAGKSTRMGERNKLLLPVGGRTVLERTVLSAVNADVGAVLVVAGPRDYGSLLAAYPVRLVRNTDYDEGMASSIRTGVHGAGPAASAYGILLADMPFIRPETISRLVRHLDAESIVVPTFEGKPGHPVLFAGRYRRELMELTGDVGARSVVRSYPSKVVQVETDDPGILLDIDTEEAYRNLKTRNRV